jgi:hypothetical protein
MFTYFRLLSLGVYSIGSSPHFAVLLHVGSLLTYMHSASPYLLDMHGFHHTKETGSGRDAPFQVIASI